MTQHELRRGLTTVDDSISKRNVDKIVAWCFGKAGPDSAMEFAAFEKRFENACLHNYPKILNKNEAAD